MDANQPKAKKPRTEAQIRAFENCLAARNASLLAKSQPVETTPTVESLPDPPAPQPETPMVLEDVSSSDVSPAHALLCNEIVAPTPPPPPPQQLLPVQETEDEYEYFDGDMVMDELAMTKAELKALKEQVQQLNTKHEEIDTTFRQHNVRQQNSLNFV